MILMTQTKITFNECASSSDNKSVPIGSIEVVSDILDLLGISQKIDGFKTKGIELSKLTKAMIVHSTFDDNSMKACSDWLSDPITKGAFGINSNVIQKTLNRALETLGAHREEIILQLHDGILKMYPDLKKDVDIDGSAILMNKESDISKYGHPRDKNPDGLQVEFMLGMYEHSRIPFYIREFKGNTSDEEMYATSLPEVIGLVNESNLRAYENISNKLVSGIKERNKERELLKMNGGKGRRGRKKKIDVAEESSDVKESLLDVNRKLGNVCWVIFDNGGASSYNTEAVNKMGCEYLTRKSMNKTDMKLVSQSDGVIVEDGLKCWCKTFDSHGRTKYIYRSDDLAESKREAAIRKVDRMAEIATDLKNGNIDALSLVDIKSNEFVKFEVKVLVQSILTDYTEEEKNELVNRYLGDYPGYFHLESSAPLTPKEAIQKYRKRVAIEHAIKSLKNLSGIKPMRVWKELSIAGQMTLALLAEAIYSIVRYDYPSDNVKVTRKGRSEIKEHKPENKTICEFLNQLTATFYRDEKGHLNRVISGVSPESLGIIERLQAKTRINRPLESFAKA